MSVKSPQLFRDKYKLILDILLTCEVFLFSENLFVLRLASMYNSLKEEIV